MCRLYSNFRSTCVDFIVIFSPSPSLLRVNNEEEGKVIHCALYRATRIVPFIFCIFLRIEFHNFQMK